MKNITITILLIILLCTAAFSQTAEKQSASKLSIGAGATFNKVEGVDMGIGYYVGLNTTAKLTNWIGYLGTLQFSNYHQKIEDIGINYYSLDPTFAFLIYPGQDKFSVLVGSTGIYVIDAKVDGEDLDVSPSGGLYFTTGASYTITEKIGILLKYNIPFNGDAFDYTASAGLTYTF